MHRHSLGRQPVLVLKPGLNGQAVRVQKPWPGSPWESGYNERFNETLHDELLNGELFGTDDSHALRHLSDEYSSGGVRDSEPGGRDYSSPRYWAAFVAYGR